MKISRRMLEYIGVEIAMRAQRKQFVIAMGIDPNFLVMTPAYLSYLYKLLEDTFDEHTNLEDGFMGLPISIKQGEKPEFSFVRVELIEK